MKVAGGLATASFRSEQREGFPRRRLPETKARRVAAAEEVVHQIRQRASVQVVGDVFAAERVVVPEAVVLHVFGQVHFHLGEREMQTDEQGRRKTGEMTKTQLCSLWCWHCAAMEIPSINYKAAIFV